MSGQSAIYTTCYRELSNGTINVFTDNFFVESTSTKYGPCCFSSAEYLADNVCYQAVPAPGSAGYYMAVCSDPTSKDPSCSKSCTSYTKGDIIWKNNQWLCCGVDNVGNPNCNNPTTEVVSSVRSPADLQAAISGTTTITTKSSSAPTSTSGLSSTSTIASANTTLSNAPNSVTSAASSVTSTTASPAASSSTLSKGAKAGIAIGVTAVILFIITAIVVIYIRRRRKARNAPSGPSPDYFAEAASSEKPPFAGTAPSKHTHSANRLTPPLVEIGVRHEPVHELS